MAARRRAVTVKPARVRLSYHALIVSVVAFMLFSFLSVLDIDGHAGLDFTYGREAEVFQGREEFRLPFLNVGLLVGFDVGPAGGT
jgi:hypothetical protein